MMTATVQALVMSAIAVVLTSAGAFAQVAASAPPVGSPVADSAGIRAAALDYIEGWYAGNAERMERALHPELAKRIVMTNRETGRNALDQIGAMTLVQRTRRGGGRETPAAEQQKDVVILDIFRNAASVKITAGSWVDYLHLARFNGRWVIINVLWELRSN